MIITSIRIRSYRNTGTKMKGVASITLDNMIAIHDIKILENDSEIFLAMPSKSKKTGDFEDIAHPINADVRLSLQNIISNAYEICIAQNMYALQFEIISERCKPSLYEQVIEDFIITESKEYDPEFVSKNKKVVTTPKVITTKKVEKESTSSDSDAEFWKWLNN